jgi:hypothetical protein
MRRLVPLLLLMEVAIASWLAPGLVVRRRGPAGEEGERVV